MPGGRLTQQERRRIALGLAEGLAYAEIARGLDRPTSTVTREVLRNGGPGSYRADLAHYATQHRTRRRRQTTPREPLPEGRDAEAVREYEDMFATVFVQSGLPRMAARVLASLTVTDTGSLTAAELARRLQASPAAISKAVTMLEGMSHVRRERDERRRERYVVDNDVFYQSMMASARTTAQLVEIARQGVGVLGADTPAATRLEGIARFLDSVSRNIARAAEEARALLHAESGRE